MKFTKKEISLCKKIAEKHEKKIVCGDWVYVTYPPQYSNPPLGTSCAGLYERIQNSTIPYKIEFVLWAISDCLEFFGERGYTFEEAEQLGGIFGVSFISGEGSTKGSGDTLLEACLEAVLAVVEEK